MVWSCLKPWSRRTSSLVKPKLGRYCFFFFTFKSSLCLNSMKEPQLVHTAEQTLWGLFHLCHWDSTGTTLSPSLSLARSLTLSFFTTFFLFLKLNIVWIQELCWMFQLVERPRSCLFLCLEVYFILFYFIIVLFPLYCCYNYANSPNVGLMKASILHSILYLMMLEVSREQRATRGKKGKSSLSFCGTWFVTCRLYSIQQQQPWRSCFFLIHIYIYFCSCHLRYLSGFPLQTVTQQEKTKLEVFGLHQWDIDIQGGTRVCSTGEPLDPEPRSDQPVIQRLQTLLHPAAEPPSDWGDSDPGLQSSTLWAQTFKVTFWDQKNFYKKKGIKKKDSVPLQIQNVLRRMKSMTPRQKK